MNNLNYGVIGNCRTAALISEKGNIEWLCFPDFDSPSIFAALLDRDKGGCFGFEVSNEYHISQSYVPHTNILSTHFSSDEGEFVVLDFMPCYRSYEKEHYLPAEIYRYIRWIKGTPRFKVNYNPAPDYARGKVIHNITDEYIETYCSSENKDRQYLYSSLSLQDIEQKKEITLQRDEFFLLSYNEKVIPIDIEREKPLLGIHDMHLLAREGSFRHRRKRRGPLPVRRNTEMLQSLGSVQRRFGLRHQRTIREFPPSLFPSGSGKHGHSICRRRQEIIVHSTLKKQKRDGITKTFLHNIVISTVPVFDF